MTNSILRITDCQHPIDLLNISNGILTCEWMPAVAQFKDGGVWQSSPLSDGKRLAYKTYENAVETFEFKIHGANQDAVIGYIQELITTLEKAIQYWTTPWQRLPVWIEARGPTETNVRYAVIKGYKIDGLSNPFSQPFFGDCRATMDRFTLVVERDHWIDQFPGTGICVELNNIEEYIKDTSSTSNFSAMSPNDDTCYMSGVGMTNPCFVGLQGSPTTLDSGIRFPNITIPPGSTILDAYITVTEAISDNDDIVVAVIFGESILNAGLFTNSADEFKARMNNPTTNIVSYRADADTWDNPGGTQTFTGLAGIVQEIVNQYGWVSGNALAIFLKHTYGSDPSYPTENAFISFETVNTGYAPILTVSYIPPTTKSTTGKSSTCTGNVYVSNKHNIAQLTHIYINGAGANLMTQPLPWTLLPSPPVAGSEVYFGIASGTGCAGPFDSLAFNLSVASVNTPLTWYYPDSAAPTWAVLEVNSDTSINLSETGDTCVIFVQPTDWAECTINGVLGWWVKATVGTPPGATTAPVQQDTALYTVLTPFVDIDGSDILGEIPALARIRLYGQATERDDPTCVVIGLRSKSRGENFTPYLNFDEVQNTPGITVGYPGFLVADTSSPTGYKLVLNITAEVDDWTTTRGRLNLDGSIASEYIGSFHAYCRYSVPTGADDDFNMRLAYSMHTTGPWNYTRPISLPYTYLNVCVADLGIIDLGGTNLAYDEKIKNLYFEVEYQHNVDTNSILWLYDIILIPVDEWAGVYRTPSNDTSGVLSSATILDIDSIGSPRGPRALLRQRSSTYSGGQKVADKTLLEDYESEWIKMTRGGPILQVNSDQRLWFTAINIASNGMMRAFFMQKLMVKVYIANRYLSMRGAI